MGKNVSMLPSSAAANVYTVLGDADVSNCI